MCETVQGVSNRLPFFGRSAMVQGENALSFVEFTFRSLDSLLLSWSTPFQELRPCRLRTKCVSYSGSWEIPQCGKALVT